MKLAIVVLSLLCCGCFASPVEKRSISDEWAYGGSYGLSSAALSAPSIASISVGAPSISSHTHTHSTAIIDRPYPVPVHTPTITSTTSFLPSTFSSYNYGLGSSYPYSFGYPSFGYSDKYFSNFGSKYYSRSLPTTIYKKSFYSSPTLKYSKW